VNHTAAKIIDSVSALPGPHAAVCSIIFISYAFFLFVKSLVLAYKTVFGRFFTVYCVV